MHGNPRLKTGAQRLRTNTKPMRKPAADRKSSNAVGSGKGWGLHTMAKSDATHYEPRLKRKILPPY